MEASCEVMVPASRGRSGWALATARVVAAIAAVAACSRGPSTPPASALWADDETAAFARARREHKVVLILFTADWSVPARQFAAWLDRPGTRAGLASDYVGWRVDVTQGDGAATAAQERYAAPGVPSLLIVDPDGRVIERYTGTLQEGQVQAILDRGRAARAASVH